MEEEQTKEPTMGSYFVDVVPEKSLNHISEMVIFDYINSSGSASASHAPTQTARLPASIRKLTGYSSHSVALLWP